MGVLIKNEAKVSLALGHMTHVAKVPRPPGLVAIKPLDFQVQAHDFSISMASTSSQHCLEPTSLFTHYGTTLCLNFLVSR